MQIKACTYNGDSIGLQAPLAPNINDKRTGFAGSLATIATLGGWALLHVKLNEDDLRADIAVYRSTLRYIRPVSSDFHSHTAFGSKACSARFIKQLHNNAEARITLDTTVSDRQGRAVVFQGKYVAVRK